MVFCPIQGHQKHEITCICIYGECQQASRLVCEDCVKEERHSHGYQCYFYLISLDKFNTSLEDFSLIDKMMVQRQLQQIENLMNEVKLIYCSFQNILAYQDIYQQHKQNNYQIQQLTKCQINSLVKLDVAQRDYYKLNYHIESLLIQIQNLKFEKIQYQMPPKLNTIAESNERDPFPIISENEKYLGIFKITYKSRKLKIISLPKTNVLYSRNIINQSHYQSFSRNSKFMVLFFKDENQIFLFQVKNLKLILKFNISQTTFQNFNEIIWINNTKLMYDSGEDIIILDIALRRTQQIINESCFDQLQYDESHDMIVASKKNIIIFVDRNNGNLIFKHQMEKPIEQFQITDMGQNLFINSNNKLQIFDIEYEMKSLQMLVHIPILQDFEFIVVNESQKVIIIQDNKLLIFGFDWDFHKIYELQISIECKFIIYQQLPNVQTSNYMLLIDNSRIRRILRNQGQNY